MNYTDAVIAVAKAEIGVVEHGAPNWGPRVSQYLASVGINWPASWCAAFNRFCMLEAARALGWITDGGLHVSGVPILFDLSPRDFAACSMLGAYASKESILFDAPRAGDLFLIRNDAGHFHHTGIVTQVLSGAYATVEGNTNDDGSATGYGVFARERVLGPHSRFVRFADEIASPVTTPRIVNPSYLLCLGGKQIITQFIGGRTYVPVRVWARALDFQFDWNAESDNVTFDGKTFTGELVWAHGQNFASLRALAAFSGLTLIVDDEKKSIEVAR